MSSLNSVVTALGLCIGPAGKGKGTGVLARAKTCLSHGQLQQLVSSVSGVLQRIGFSDWRQFWFQTAYSTNEERLTGCQSRRP